MDKGKKILFNLITAVIIPVLFFLLAELIATINYKFIEKKKFYPLMEVGPDTYAIPEAERNQFIKDLGRCKYVYKEFVQLTSSPMDTKTIYVNKQGWRNYELPKAKPAGEYRIFLFGGSETWGIATPFNEHTIAGYLEDICDNRDWNIRVINVGERGFSFNQETVRAITEVLDYHPDMLIFFHGLNEIGKIANGNPVGTYFFYNLFKMNYDHSFFNIVRLLDLKRRLVVSSRAVSSLISFLESRVFLRNKVARFDDVASRITKEDIVNNYERNAKVIKDVCEAEGIKYYFVLQPAWYFYKPEKGPYEKEIGSYFDRDAVYGKNFEKFYRHYYPALIDFCENNSAKCHTYSFLKIFSSVSTDIYADPIHTLAAGNKIIARDLHELIKEDLPK